MNLELTNNIHTSKSEIVNDIQKARKSSSGWWCWVGELIDTKGTGHMIKIKGYQTHMQIFTIDGVKHWSTIDGRVKDMTNDINEALGHIA